MTTQNSDGPRILVGPTGMIQAETHCHTKDVSICGCVPAKEAARIYKEKGYEVLVITDHYYEDFWDLPNLRRRSWEGKMDKYLAGYRAAREEGEKIGLTVLFALELQFDNFRPYDFLIYGPDEEYLYKNPNLNKATAEEFHQECIRRGFLMYQAHPYRYNKQPVEPVCYDGIEVFNGHPRHNSHNAWAVEFARAHGLKTISGSDSHQFPDLGRGGIMLPAEVRTMDAMVQHLKEHDHPELIITFEPEGREFIDDRGYL